MFKDFGWSDCLPFDSHMKVINECCWKPARMYETLHGFIRSIPSFLSWCRSLMDFVHHNNQTIDVFVAKEYPLSSANFSLRTLFFPSFSSKHLDHRTKKKPQKSCKSGMLSLHFLGFQVELVTEMAIPLLLGFRLLSQMSSCSHCWGTVGKIYEPLPVKRAMWIHVAEFILNVWTILNRTYIQNHSADIGVKLFWRPKPSRFFNHKKHLILHNYTDSTLKNAPFSKGSAPGCSMTEALLGSPAPEYGVRWNGKSQWRWNLFCRENTAGYRSICRLLCIYIYIYLL